MNKLFFLLVLVFNNVVFANESLFELNSQNLTLLSFKDVAQEDFDKYVLNLIQTQHSDEYYPVRKDPKKLKALIKKYSDKVKESASKFTGQTHFRWGHRVSYEKFDSNQSLLTIRNFLFGSSKAVPVNKSLDDGLPSNFLLLIANIDMIENIKIDAEKFQSFIDSRKNNKNKMLYLEMILVLPKFQNRDNFQAVIKEINVYDSSKKKVLLANRKEPAQTSDLINDWMLSDGYSNKLIGIHAFSFLGYRLQDLLRDVNAIKDYCDKSQKLGKHQVYVCSRPYGENTMIVITFIGGIVAKIDLVAKSELSQKEKKVVAQSIMTKLGQSKSIFNETKVQWSKYNSDFVFYSDAFFGQKSDTSKYTYTFAGLEKQKETDFTLIVSMISQETKQLIENNK